MDGEIGGLLERATKELERLLNTKTVVGEPMEVHGRTIIPLISVGFGIGVGGGRGNDKRAGEGGGAGIGMGGGARPIALLISEPSGARLEVVRGSGASAAEHIAETVARVVGKKFEGQGSKPEP